MVLLCRKNRFLSICQQFQLEIESNPGTVPRNPIHRLCFSEASGFSGCCAILSATNISLSISRKKKQIVEPAILYRISISLFLNILRAFTIPDTLIDLLKSLSLMKLNYYTGNRPNLVLNYFLFSVSTF